MVNIHRNSKTDIDSLNLEAEDSRSCCGCEFCRLESKVLVHPVAYAYISFIQTTLESTGFLLSNIRCAGYPFLYLNLPSIISLVEHTLQSPLEQPSSSPPNSPLLQLF